MICVAQETYNISAISPFAFPHFKLLIEIGMSFPKSKVGI